MAAAEVLRRNAVKTSKSTICLMLKKPFPLWIKEDVSEVCVDDFAIRKRHTYGTIMVDIQTLRVIDLIPSRKTGDVTAWLKEYPNLKVVSRDGSRTKEKLRIAIDIATLKASKRKAASLKAETAMYNC